MTLLAPPAEPAAAHTGPSVEQLVLVDINGVWQQVLNNFQITQVQWQLNGMGLIQFTIPTTEPTFVAYGMATAAWEIQYFRYGQLYWWGVMVDVEILGDGSTTQVTGYGLLWYAHKRFFGMANRVNWIKGYSYDDGFTIPASSNFTAVDTTATYDVAPPSPLIGQHGTYTDGTYTAVRLSGADDSYQTAGEDAYIEQSVSFSKAWTPQAPGLILTAWYYLEAFTGPAAKFAGLGATMRGLVLQLFDSDGVTPLHNIIGNAQSGLAVSVAQITSTTPQSQWVRLQVGLVPPSGVPFVAQLRFYAPGGIIWWSGLALNQEDGYYPGVGTTSQGIDENVIVQRIAQICFQPTSLMDDNLEQMDTSKTDLNFGFDCPTMDIKRTASYPYANHQNILEALNDWNSQYQGLDMEVMFPDTTHRNFTTWGTANKGRKGVFHPELPLFIDPFLNSGQFSANAENGGNNVLEIGVDMSTTIDSGAANIEGGFIDLTKFAGKDIEIVETAPNDISIGALTPLAQQREQSIGGTPNAPVIRTMASDATFGPIIAGAPGWKVGDTVPVFGSYGWMTFSGEVYRILQLDLYPADDGMVLDVTLGLPDPYAQVPDPV